MNRTAIITLGLAVALILAGVSGAQAAGYLIAKDETIPPLAVKYLRVNATIDNQAATTHVEQEFINSTSQNLECTFIFPLPKGAAIRDFAMYIGGKRTKGELVEKDKARQVYEEIVRRMRDPGLLEYMDCDLLKMRIFPVPANGTQKVEVEYSELIPMDGGLGEYVFPLRTGEKASKTMEDFTVAVRIKSDVPIKNVYSPTHEIGLSRPSEREAVAGMEMKAARLDTDFTLFYSVDEKDFGLSLMSYRPDPEKPGMFLMLISPKSEVNEGERVPRDLAFVIDTSGSMRGEKIEQARSALKQCVSALDPRDRFAIVQFNTTAESLSAAWNEATQANKDAAAVWIGKLNANGGTNIKEALDKVLALRFDQNRPATILFLTDGKPTVDVTDNDQLVAMLKDKNARGLRLFSFGVGDDVNTHLLDRMCETTGGLPEYVRPTEAIDRKVVALFSKMSHPVLTDLSVELTRVKVSEMYPRQLPDLFRGSQLVLVGAYEGDGDAAIRLKGRVGDRKEEFVYEGTFPKQGTERSFIGAIFAQRKIGYLLDQIRLHGEEPELKDEVIRLSLAYGIQTPYTSYLVLENEQQYKQYGLARQSEARPAPAGEPEGARERSNMDETLKAIQSAVGAPPSLAPEDPRTTSPAESPVSGKFAAPDAMRFDVSELRGEEVGSKAVDIARRVRKMKETEGYAQAKGSQAVVVRNDRQFFSYRGVWVDERFEGTETQTKIKWASEAFFKLAEAHPELRTILTLGDRLIVVTARGKAVVVDPDEGIERLDDGQLRALFTDAD